MEIEEPYPENPDQAGSTEKSNPEEIWGRPLDRGSNRSSGMKAKTKPIDRGPDRSIGQRLLEEPIDRLARPIDRPRA